MNGPTAAVLIVLIICITAIIVGYINRKQEGEKK